MRIDDVNKEHKIMSAKERLKLLEASKCDNIMCGAIIRDEELVDHTKFQCPEWQYWEKLLRRFPDGRAYTLTYVARHQCKKHGKCQHVLVSNRVSLILLCLKCEFNF